MGAPNKYIVLRSGAPHSGSCPCCGAALQWDERVVLNLPTNSLVVDDKALTFTSKEAELIAALMECWPNAGTREQLLSKVFGITACHRTVRVIDTLVKRVRAQIRGTRVWIETVHGSGYQLRVYASPPRPPAAENATGD